MDRKSPSPPKAPAASLALLEGERRVFERITAGADLGQTLREIVELCEHHSSRPARCAALLPNDAGDRLTVGAAPSLPERYQAVAASTPVAAESNPSGVAAWSKQPVVVEDFQAEPRWNRLREDVEALGLRSGLALPILSQRGRVLGVLAAYSTAPGRPEPEDLLLMQHFTELMRIAIEKHQAERTIERMTNFDGLTGLPNRTLLLDHLDDALLRRTPDAVIALLLFNLDSMKQVNDTLGYEFGNRCLQALAVRIGEYLGGRGLFARVGGDEFGVALTELEGESALPGIVQALLDTVTQPLKLGEREVFITASLGVSIAGRDGDDADTLFKHADVALHRAKQQGRNGFRFFDASMNAPAARRMALLGEIRHALERGEFEVHYQPQLEVASGALTGAEALLRWHSPGQGSVSPSEFIPLLEETGLILGVGEWVLERVCADLVQLQDAAVPPLRIAVNLSARQFMLPDLAERIEGILAKHQVPAERLTFEITESLLMRDPANAVHTLRRLHDIHVKIALDDFGTGYSSLSYLRRFPVDELKVDQSFVAGLAHSEADAAITDAVIRLAHSLGMQVLAEGVEHEAQRDFLARHGCDRMQGYLTGRPMGLDAFRRLVEAQAARARFADPAVRAPGTPAAR